ncbi:MAG TPA: replication-relaxation family protein [Candidatus Dormibacteraeota bacterium]|nr:replication-relaxation family protein [Candidatus Dormibacteraeota bacterium]
MKLPYITTKQAEILKLLYTFRFLDRIQLQAFMNHKDKRRVLAWLKDLREKQHLEWIYSTDFAEKMKPAIYYLGINGIRYLKTLEWDDDSTIYPIEELRKRYKEADRSRTFVDRSLLVADCCLALKAVNGANNGTNSSKVTYSYVTEAEYIDSDHEYHFLAELEVLRPNLCIVKQEQKRGEDEPVTTNYLLEIFDSTLPRYRMRRRLKGYVTYLDDREWESSEPEPIILLVCPSITELVYAKRATKKLIEDTYEDDLHVRFTTAELLKRESVTVELWEEGKLRYGL